ncbi:hypothetical protein ACA910_015082 [Epithemia clementina (nom. ined.)]
MDKIERKEAPQRTSLTNETISSNDHERLIKAAVARSKSSSRLFGRSRRGFTEEELAPKQQQQQQQPQQQQQQGPPIRTVRRRHSTEMLQKVGLEGIGSNVGGGGGTAEYREVVVNGKKKLVRVKKKSAAEAAADTSSDGHRKLVKVKVKQVMKKHTQQQNEVQSSVPIKVGIPANHQLRKPSTPSAQPSKYSNMASDNISGVWSKAARSIFSFGNDKRSKASSGGDPTETDLVFQPEVLSTAEGGRQGGSGNDQGDGNKSQSKPGYKPPTQLNGEPGVLTKKKTPDAPEEIDGDGKENDEGGEVKNNAPPLSPRQPEFFARYVAGAGDFALQDGPPMEIHTNAMTKTKTKSVFQSESMIRRQFIQDQWLSGGSNYQVWEKATANNLVDMSVVTAVTEYTTDQSSKGDYDEEMDNVSEITHEDLVPDMLLEIKPQDELELWEALCTDHINRYGPRSALTAESFVNRGIAQMQADRLDEAADSLLSAVCFLEEVHGTIDHNDRNGNGGAPSHMHMAQAFYFLGRVYMLQEQYPMAESAFYKALNIRQQHLGKVHPDAVECWEQIGLSYIQRAAQARGDKQQILERQAMDILSQVLKLKRAIFGSIHVSVARTARSVAKLCAMRNESERAQRLYKQVLNVLAQMDKDLTSIINPDFPDPRDIAKHKERRKELTSIDEEMRRYGLKEEILEI